MSYIGRQPQIGNFQICDAISTVNNQAAYTMQVGSVNVLPETANHMIVSLNGVIQAPISSFTVSGSTITFAANLVTGDVINFIQILGDVLDLGVPSDGTVTSGKLATNAVTTVKITDANVTTAKITDNAITLAKMASGTDGNIISYDTSGNPVAVATGNDGQVLTSAGAGAIPTFETLPAGGLEVADQWRLTTSLDVADAFITANLEQTDTGIQGNLGSSMTQSSGVFTFPSTGFYWVKANAQFSHNGNTRQCQFGIYATADNSNYVQLSLQHSYITIGASGNTTTSLVTDTLIDVSNTTNVKVKFWMAGTGGGEDLKGDSAVNATYFTFIKLGAT